MLPTVYDACVLYPAPLRDCLMELALSGAVEAHWTEAIQDEWIRNLLANRSDLVADQLDRTRREMERAVPYALVTDYQHHAEDLELPDPDDRHVLAAAIECEARVIVTFNLRDFPAEVLGAHGVRALHPDAFALEILRHDSEAIVAAARRQRGRLQRPPKTREEFCQTLARVGLVKTAVELARFEDW